jgi:hypothetical protein
LNLLLKRHPSGELIKHFVIWVWYRKGSVEMVKRIWELSVFLIMGLENNISGESREGVLLSLDGQKQRNQLRTVTCRSMRANRQTVQTQSRKTRQGLCQKEGHDSLSDAKKLGEKIIYCIYNIEIICALDTVFQW